MADNARMMKAAETWGTPAFVFDEGAFERRMGAVRAIFGEGIDLCFAVKANPFLIPAAARCADRLEVCSPGELQICKAEGIDPSLVLFSGVNKTAESVADAMEFGVYVLTAESLRHLRLIEAEAARRDERADVLLRLNAGSQFGMSRDDLLWAIDHRGDFPHIHIVGIHYFVGTQRMKLKHQVKELSMLADLIDELQTEHGFTCERLEYGPGLGVPLFEGEDFEDTLAPARELAETLCAISAKAQLTVEMGRFFATECGTYLTAVNDLKSNKGVNYCIVDGGIHHLTYYGQMMGMKTPIIQNLTAESDGRAGAEAAAGEDAREWCLCGSLCTTGDVLTRAAALGELREGDVLAFRNAGAYAVTEGIHLLLSRQMPAIIMTSENGELRLVRKTRETYPLNMRND